MLFAGLAPQPAQLPAAPPTILADREPEPEAAMPADQLSRLVEEVARKLHQVGASGMGSTSAPSGGMAPEVQVSSTANAEVPPLTDRGLYQATQGMKDMYQMGDAPSCGTCGAIMVRNGSCYRCMECGSTSGCS